jgi:YMGG-like Gly-zipper
VLATAQPICSASNHAGDRFVGTLREAVAATDGGTLAAGTDVVLELSSVIVGPADHGRVELIARGISIDGYIRPIDAEVAWVDALLERREVKGPPGSSSDASKVTHGALSGAILGRIFSRGAKGAVIGAAAGAAAGAATARSDAQYEGCLPKGATVKMRLTGPLTVVGL